jgi:CDP-diacylglycerol--glycerol-3-phosphate 3-phosphatidyltransferase
VPSIYDLKPAFQRRLRPIAGWLAAHGWTPNQITLAALGLSVVTGLLLWLRPADPAVLLAVPLVLLLRMGLNAIDGMLAREHGMTSRLGALLNEAGDVIADAALYLPFALISDTQGELVVVAVVLAGVTELMGVAAIQIGARRRYDGPMGKSDRAFVFGALALLLGLGVPPGRWFDLIMLGVLALLIRTITNRAGRALAEHSG